MAAQETEVIVIGAGISGLCAAKLLTDSGLKCIVLEARDRVGGRTFTKRDPKVAYVDLGGSYVGPTQEPLIRIAKEMGIENYKINEVEDCVFYNDGKRHRYRPTKFPTFWNPFVTMDFINFLREVDRMADEIPTDAPWKAPKAELWDTMTFKEFVDKTVWTQTVRNFAKLFIDAFVASTAYESSLLWFLWYIKQCGGVDRMVSSTNGGQERKFIGGSQQVSERLAERLGERVQLNKPVYFVQQENNSVIVKTLDGKEYKGKYIISAIPPPLLMKIHFSPSLPPLKNQLIQRMPMGSVIKVIVYYKTPFWRKLGFCGSSCIYESNKKDTSFCFTFDDTKPDGSYPALIGFICADDARDMVSLTKAQRCEKVCGTVVKMFGSDEGFHPVHYEDYAWMAEQYSGGCYTSMCPPGLITKYGKVLREPFLNMFFAGTETATSWSGYMSGAVQAGQRAAREVLHATGKITADMVWNVKEAPSKEIPARPFTPTFIEKYSPSVPQFLKFVTGSVAIGGFAVLWFNCGRLGFLQKVNFFRK